MTSRFAFPYGIRFQEDGKIDVFPAVEILVIGRGGRGIRATFHIDSGATTSVLPLSDADTIGAPVRRTKRVLVRGIGGDAYNGYAGIVAAELGGIKLRLPVIFIEDVAVPRILGREGVFPRFGIAFDESRRRTAFLDSRKERQIINALF